jgi:glc operon protein GlcG
MNTSQARIIRLIKNIEELIPLYLKNNEEKNISNGNVAVCIIDGDGGVYGKVFVNSDKIRARESFRVAWVKASQVWLTGMKTGEYEKKIFNGELSERESGIKRPDFIGWQGGQPVVLKDGSKISAGFSGFHGETDLEIVLKASEKIE